LTPFRLLCGMDTILLEEIKHKSFRTTTEARTCPKEAEDKDMLEPDMLNVIVNLQKYQAKTKAWRDLKVKPKAFEVRDIDLLQSPYTESSRKLESKCIGSYAVTKKLRLGAPKEKCWSIRGMWIIFIVFMFKQLV
jgi:hypothetical protein